MAPLPTRFRNTLDEAVKAFAFCLVLNTSSAVTTVPSSTNDLHNSRWQSGEICQVLSTAAFALFCHVFDGIMDSSLSVHACLLPPHVRKYVLSSSFVTVVLLSCSRVCLLDVSRLLGLTLRHSALVCSCHRDSLTRWRLSFAQEAVRVASSASSQLSFWAAMCLMISDSL